MTPGKQSRDGFPRFTSQTHMCECKRKTCLRFTPNLNNLFSSRYAQVIIQERLKISPLLTARYGRYLQSKLKPTYSILIPTPTHPNGDRRSQPLLYARPSTYTSCNTEFPSAPFHRNVSAGRGRWFISDNKRRVFNSQLVPQQTQESLLTQIHTEPSQVL